MHSPLLTNGSTERYVLCPSLTTTRLILICLSLQRHSKTRALLKESRLLLVAHRAELNSCPFKIYPLTAPPSMNDSQSSRPAPPIAPSFSLPQPPLPPPPTLPLSSISSVSPPIRLATSMSAAGGAKVHEADDHARGFHVEEITTLHVVQPIAAPLGEASSSIGDNLTKALAGASSELWLPQTTVDDTLKPTQHMGDLPTVQESSVDVPPSIDVMETSTLFSEHENDKAQQVDLDVSPKGCPNVPPAPADNQPPAWAGDLTEDKARPSSNEVSAGSPSAITIGSSTALGGTPGSTRKQQRPAISIVTTVPRRGSSGESCSAPPWTGTPHSAQRRRPMRE